ncbi:succinyl-diaminopimelate desuccinylase [Candidatus Hydrogenosomobacter endosymbioticus]|uniref:Succinyl-diaminopimelate desuccinylase n=1 Tax=Candidatus Hydrogenosomobacter endosymbioticus TaxID=2558174 RepID=A0ABM7V8Q3_9PROT|nr:succinyl-diaminopimelate desuccinylase [Candidatus Hydrogenosomobacter endosymbioticus]BDB96176.1 succinyl-diaminopimelate desuccinylase [Candidatus Hydrogenosomobacter endosymbioticus]
MIIIDRCPVKSAVSLLSYKSITPNDDGAISDIAHDLRLLGFWCAEKNIEDTANLYAYRSYALRKSKSCYSKPNIRHICFVGHVDVVPPGDLSMWKFDPFTPTVDNGVLYARGAVDMKGAIAAFLSAVCELEDRGFGCCEHSETDEGSGEEKLMVSILLTSDEEGTGTNGIKQMVGWLQKNNYIPDFFLIGEPTGGIFGECVNVGRRGSVCAELVCRGVQGHIAYPHLFDNPISRMLDCLRKLCSIDFDCGLTFPEFQKSRLEVTSIDVGNNAVNVTPEKVFARFGVRFNPLHTCDSICDAISSVCAELAGDHVLSFHKSGEAFFTNDAGLIGFVKSSVGKITCMPRESTDGGTTDGRFLSVLAPVIEFGLPETTMHKVNECVSVLDIEMLKKVYLGMLEELVG